MKTALYDSHVALGAKIVDFSGWEMPLHYKGILEEHRTVRESAGVFDVSHMGRIHIKGADSERFLDQISTNIILGKKDHQAIYSILCQENGFPIDDVIVLRHSSNECSVISNASNRERVYQHLLSHAKSYRIDVSPSYENEGILAIQGPQSLAIASSIFKEVTSIPPMSSIRLNELIISTTGYTGEKGLEFFGPKEAITFLWLEFIKKGVAPIGLGARDTLRLEKGYALYGHELTESIFPTESVAAWAVKLNKANFVGKEALIAIENSNQKRYQYGVILQDAGIARAGHLVKEPTGVVTSGTFSPTLKKSIAIIMVNKKLHLNDKISIQVRDKQSIATVVVLPFV